MLCALLAGAMWGMVFITPRALPTFSSWELTLGHYSAYGVIAAIAAAPIPPRTARKITRADCLALVRQSCSGNLAYSVFVAFGVQLVGVAPTSLIVGILLITVTMLGRCDHGAILLSRLIWPLLVVAAGIACINVDPSGQTAATAATNVWPVWQRIAGIAYAVGTLPSWTWYALDSARYLQHNSHSSSNEWSALYGISSGILSAALITVALLTVGTAWIGAGGHIWATFWAVNVAVALGASLIGNNLWNIASRRPPLTLSGQMIVFETLFALAYGFAYDDRWPRPFKIAVIALLILGVGWSVRLHANDKPT